MELRIKQIAKQKGMQLKDVADRMGKPREVVTRAINGNPQLSTLEGIAQALEVDITELFPLPQQNNVTGYLEYNGKVIKINNKNDLFNLVDEIKSQE